MLNKARVAALTSVKCLSKLQACGLTTQGPQRFVSLLFGEDKPILYGKICGVIVLQCFLYPFY